MFLFEGNGKSVLYTGDARSKSSHNFGDYMLT